MRTPIKTTRTYWRPPSVLVHRNRQFLSIPEMARRLLIAENYAYGLVARGTLPVALTRHGRRYVSAVQVEGYRQRRDAWLRAHGRKHRALSRSA